jgi:hypothetical protein
LREYFFDKEQMMTTLKISILWGKSTKWEKFSLLTICVLFCASTFFIVSFRGPQISDFANYVRLAKNNIESGTYYPNNKNLYDAYIHAPGFVNYLILLFKISTNLKLVYVFNLLWTFVLLFSLRYIISRLFNNKQIVSMATVIFCMMPILWGKVVIAGTDVIYTALAFLSFAILLREKKYGPIVSGIILAVANWVRPLAPAFLIGMLIHLLIVKKKKQIVKLLAAFAVFVVSIGLFTYSNLGYFLFQSSTSGVNMIMGANDDADGGYNTTCFQEGKIAYLDDNTLKTMTFKHRDSYYRGLAVQWIMKHPIKWALLLPKKIFRMYAIEDLGHRYVFVPTLDADSDSDSGSYIINHWFANNRQFGDYILMWGQLLYMITAIGFLAGTVILIKQRNILRFLPLFSMVFLGSFMTLVTFGAARFHIPYLPVFIIFTAACLSVLLRRINYDKSNKPKR